MSQLSDRIYTCRREGHGGVSAKETVLYTWNEIPRSGRTRRRNSGGYNIAGAFSLARSISNVG